MHNDKNWTIHKKVLIAFLFIVLSAVSFWYGDIQSNVRHSMNIWKALFEGRFFEFYSYNLVSLEIGETPHGGGYEVLLYLIMAIWNLPLYVIERLIGTDILAFFPARVYAKLMLVLFAVFAGKLTKRIALLCGLREEKADECCYLFLGNAVVFSSVSVTGQIDIIGLVFILLAFTAYLKKENVKFYLWFILSISCKFFALFVFIPLILIREKNIIKVLLKIGLPIGIVQAVNIPFQIADPVGVAHKSEPTGVVIEELLNMKIPFLGQNLPYIFLLLGGCVCWRFYVRRKEK